MTASVELMSMLHDMVGQKLLERIASGEATAAEFAQAIKFLKDNGIDVAMKEGSTLDKLEKSVATYLPFSDVGDPTTYQ